MFFSRLLTHIDLTPRTWAKMLISYVRRTVDGKLFLTSGNRGFSTSAGVFTRETGESGPRGIQRRLRFLQDSNFKTLWIHRYTSISFYPVLYISSGRFFPEKLAIFSGETSIHVWKYLAGLFADSDSTARKLRTTPLEKRRTDLDPSHERSTSIYEKSEPDSVRLRV